MSGETSSEADRCEHLYERFRRWPVKERWRCARCGFVTRHFDGLDWQMGRPIHRHMSVAVKGVNTR